MNGQEVFKEKVLDILLLCPVIAKDVVHTSYLMNSSEHKRNRPLLKTKRFKQLKLFCLTSTTQNQGQLAGEGH